MKTTKILQVGGNALRKLIKARDKVLCLCIALSLLAVGYLGGLFTAENPSYATTGSLISKNGVWYGGAGDNGAQITVGWSGWYTITVIGGATSGKCGYGSDLTSNVSCNASGIKANVYLSKGDVLRFNKYQHGSGTISYGYWHENKNGNEVWRSGTFSYTAIGCDASAMWLNGSLLLGAGEKAEINNSLFGCGCPAGQQQNPSWTWSTQPEVPSGFSLPAYQSHSYCYLDTSRATLVEFIAEGTNTISFRVEAKANTVDDSYDAQISQANYQKEMVEQLKKIADNSGSSGGSGFTDDIPTVTVGKNENFDVVLSVYDDMASGTSETVQVVNSAVGDNIIHLIGRYTQTGVYKVTINSKKFIINVIENPNATNVTVRLE